MPDLLKLTSGTTSAPRAIRFRAEQLVADAAHICAGMGIRADDVNFGVIPFAHSSGFSNLLTPLLTHGVRLVASADRLPRAVLAGLAATGATVFPGTPVFFQKLADLEQLPALPALRLCISAGAPRPGAAAERFAARFGRKIHVFYGASECGGISYDAGADLRCEDGFVGTPLPGVEVVPAGASAGAVAVRSAAVGDGYFPADGDAALRGGQFVPGDLVRRGARGLYLAGRTSDVINVAGRKLNPLAVEARIAGCPGVTQVVVFGVPSALRGEEPVACVAGTGLDAAAVQRFCHETLSPWQVPRVVWIVAEIPADERGKISRRAKRRAATRVEQHPLRPHAHQQHVELQVDRLDRQKRVPQHRHLRLDQLTHAERRLRDRRIKRPVIKRDRLKRPDLKPVKRRLLQPDSLRTPRVFARSASRRLRTHQPSAASRRRHQRRRPPHPIQRSASRREIPPDNVFLV